MEYEADLPAPDPSLAERIRLFLGRTECVVQRRRERETKPVEIRRYVMAIEPDGARVLLRIRVTDQGTAKPEEVLQALGIEMSPGIRIRKTYTELGTRA